MKRGCVKTVPALTRPLSILQCSTGPFGLCCKLLKNNSPETVGKVFQKILVETFAETKICSTFAALLKRKRKGV